MKQVIDGKVYNTDTATEIADYYNGLSHSDFGRVQESLYKTKKGAFFLAGEGGPMSKYSRPCGNMTSGGSGVFPLTENEARTWAEEHDVDADMIEEVFNVEEA